MKRFDYKWVVVEITLDGETVGWFDSKKEAEQAFKRSSESSRKSLLEVQLLYRKRRYFTEE